MATGSLDLLVVGNGVLGVSLAVSARMLDPGVRVGVLGEPDRPGAATPASGAMLGCFGEITRRLLSSEPGRAKLALAVQARERWPGWLDTLGELAPGVDRIRTAEDTIVILNSVSHGAVDDANYAAIEESLTAHGQRFDRLDPAAVPWLDPDPNSRPLRALRIPDEGAVDSGALLGALDTAARNLSVAVIAGTAARVDVVADTVTGVTLTDGTVVPAGQVVLATGARTQQLIDGLGDLAPRVPRMCSGYGVSALVGTASGAAPPTVLRTPNRAFACGLHLVPREPGTVYVGATNFVSLEPRQGAAVKDVLFVLTCVVNQLRRDLNGAPLLRVQQGNRPVPIDGYPLIGGTSISGLWMLTGTYRDGLHLSPLLAEHMVNVLSGGPGRRDLHRFRPERELIQPASREQVLCDVVEHSLASGFEIPWRVGPGWPLYFADLVHQAHHGLAESISDYYTPPAEVLVALYHADDALRDRIRQYYKDTYRVWHSAG